MHELPLVLFTVIGQMSVGSFVVLGIIHLLARRYTDEELDKVTDPALYAIGPVLVLGFLASLLHLGSPLRALNSLLHLQSSWLSREILVGIIFAVLGAAFAVAQWFKIGPPILRKALAFLAAIVGLALVYCMARVYMLPTVPAWDTWTTPAGFYLTTFLLGSVAVGAALAVTYWVRRRGAVARAVAGEETPDTAPAVDDVMDSTSDRAGQLVVGTLRWIAIASMVLMGLQFLRLPLWVGGLITAETPAATTSARTVLGELMPWFVVRMGLVFIGVGLLGLFLFKLVSRYRKLRTLAMVSVVAFVLVLAGEFAGRVLFYDSFTRIGL